MLLVIDARAGLAAGDEEIAAHPAPSGRPVLVVANKVDDARHEAGVPGAARARAGRSVAGVGAARARHRRSAGRGGGSGCEQVTASEYEEVDQMSIRVAILGRPNVGKSSLAERHPGPAAGDRVTDVPGTTRDSDRHRVRARRRPLPADRHGRASAQAQAPPGDRVLQRAAGPAGGRTGRHRAGAGGSLARASSRAIWRWQTWPARPAARRWWCCPSGTSPTVTIDDVADRLAGKLRQRPAIVTTSPLTGRNIDRVLDTVERAVPAYSSRIGTGPLNRVIAEIRRQPRAAARRAASA